MRILHLLYESKGDPFGIGGVGLRAYEIYKNLRDRHEITLLCKRYPGARDGEIEGLNHIFAGVESPGFAKTLLSYACHASRFVRRHGMDFDVIIEEFSPAIPTMLGFYRGRPVILQVQGYTGKQYFDKYNLFYAVALYAFERLLPLSYRHFIVVSEETRKRYGIAEAGGLTEVIPNGIKAGYLECEPVEGDYVLYLGRIDIHHKGLDTLLQAYTDFRRTLPEARLVIAGDGRDRERFFAMVGALPEPVRRSIDFRGWVEGREKADLLKNALMVVMPSRYETQGIVALEAMACGKALVVSDIPELRYVPENGAGLSFRPGDAASLSSAMKDLARGADKIGMGMKGRNWVKRFTWEAIALRYENFLFQVLREDNKRG